MIKRAQELVEQGRAVYILANNDWHKDQIKKELGPRPIGITVEAAASLRSIGEQAMALRDKYPNTEVIMDHYVIFTRWSRNQD